MEFWIWIPSNRHSSSYTPKYWTMEDRPLALSLGISEIDQLRDVSFTAQQEKTGRVWWLPSCWRLFFVCILRKPKVNSSSKLAGIDDEAVSRDYALTRVGREPARAMIMARLAKEPLFASNNEAALNMFTCRYGHHISSSLPEFHGPLIVMEPCSRFSSTSRRNTVVQKHIYEAMWASQTTISKLSRDISLSLEYHTYNLETWMSHTYLPCNHLSSLT